MGTHLLIVCSIGKEEKRRIDRGENRTILGRIWNRRSRNQSDQALDTHSGLRENFRSFQSNFSGLALTSTKTAEAKGPQGIVTFTRAGFSFRSGCVSSLVGTSSFYRDSWGPSPGCWPHDRRYYFTMMASINSLPIFCCSMFLPN